MKGILGMVGKWAMFVLKALDIGIGETSVRGVTEKVHQAGVVTHAECGEADLGRRDARGAVADALRGGVAWVLPDSQHRAWREQTLGLTSKL